MTDTATVATPPEISLDTVMARRFALVEEQAIIQGRHKAELAPLDEEIRLCEQWIKDQMITSGLEQVKTAAGMSYFTTKDSCSVEDMGQVVRCILGAAPPPVEIAAVNDPSVWAMVVNHIAAHGLWDLLNKAVNKTTAREYTELHKTPPPGVKFQSFRDLAWRRGKG